MNRLADESCFNPTVETFSFCWLFSNGNLYQYLIIDDLKITLLQCYILITHLIEDRLHKSDQFSIDGSHEHEPN